MSGNIGSTGWKGGIVFRLCLVYHGHAQTNEIRMLWYEDAGHTDNACRRKVAGYWVRTNATSIANLETGVSMLLARRDKA